MNNQTNQVQVQDNQLQKTEVKIPEPIPVEAKSADKTEWIDVPLPLVGKVRSPKSAKLDAIDEAIVKENVATFFRRVEGVFPPSEVRKIRLAYILSKAGHRGQFRKECDELGNPIRYFEHPRRTALILLDELRIADWQMIAACLLHDTLEDVKEFTPEMLEEYFGTEVCRIVTHLTKPKEGDGELYWTRLEECANWQTLVVKCADRLDNLRSLKQCSREFQEKQIRETNERFFVLLADLRLDYKKPELSIKLLDKMKEAIETVKKTWTPKTMDSVPTITIVT